MNKLAHFTNINALINHILPQQKLRASNLLRLNDPLENEWPKVFSYESNDGGVVPTDYQCFYEKHAPQIGKFIKVLCFSSYDHHLIKKMPFSAPHLNMRMWSQYGDGHKGACLIFEKEDLIGKSPGENNILCSDDVMYDSQPAPWGSHTCHNISEFNTSNSSIEDFFHENVKKDIKSHPGQIFTKRMEWRDELEFRLAFYESQLDFSYLSIANKIKEIHFGAMANEKNIEIVSNLFPEIPLFKLTLHEKGVKSVSLIARRLG